MKSDHRLRHHDRSHAPLNSSISPLRALNAEGNPTATPRGTVVNVGVPSQAIIAALHDALTPDQQANHLSRLRAYATSAVSLNRAPLAIGRTPTDEDIRFIRSRYDENVQFADHLVGQLVETVRDAGRYDDALIVVTSDHGEAFFEHGRFLHTRFLYDEFLRIPMVVKWPSTMNGFPPAVDTVVSLVDLAPTLSDGLALDLAEGVGFQGRTFLPATFDGEKADWPVFAQTQGVSIATARQRPSQALVGNRYKLIHDELSGETELFDLLADPAERTPLNASQPFLAAYQLQQLQLQRQRNLVTRAEHVQQPEQELDEESIRRLRALGYVR